MLDKGPWGPRDSAQEPSLKIAHLPLRERLADIVNFIWAPTPIASPITGLRNWNATLVVTILIVFTFDFVIDYMLHLAINFIDEETGIMPEAVDFEINPAFEIFSLIVLAPLIEEPLFRGWLSGKMAALRFGAIGMVAATLLILPEYIWLGAATQFLPLLGLLVAIVGYVQWRARKDHETAVPAFFNRHYCWFVWISAFLFGLWHIGNYEALSHPLGVLVLLPLMVGGLFLAYTRTRLGLRAAMLHHAMYNGVWAAIDYGGIVIL